MNQLGLRQRWAAVIFFCFVSLSGAEESKMLDRVTAQKLIAEAEQVRVAEVTVGPIHRVQEKVANGLQTQDGVCVTFVGPQVKKGGRRRGISYRTFYFDDEWGWYLYAKLERFEGANLATIEVVSQYKGRFTLQ